MGLDNAQYLDLRKDADCAIAVSNRLMHCEIDHCESNKVNGKKATTSFLNLGRVLPQADHGHFEWPL